MLERVRAMKEHQHPLEEWALGVALGPEPGSQERERGAGPTEIRGFGSGGESDKPGGIAGRRTGELDHFVIGQKLVVDSQLGT